ncbi:hypothetical protein ScPMuIL_013411 [Solemya velum]
MGGMETLSRCDTCYLQKKSMLKLNIFSCWNGSLLSSMIRPVTWNTWIMPEMSFFCQKGETIDKLPPTQYVLLQHTKRIAYQAGTRRTNIPESCTGSTSVAVKG